MMGDPAGRWTQWPPSESERDTGGGDLSAEGLEANVNERTSFYSTILNLQRPTTSTQAAGTLWGVVGCEQLMVFPLGSQSPGGSPLHHGASTGLSLLPLSQAPICYWRRAEK